MFMGGVSIPKLGHEDAFVKAYSSYTDHHTNEGPSSRIQDI
jgi:hypothetical protein